MGEAARPQSGAGAVSGPLDPAVAEAVEAWGREVDGALARMTETISAALAEHERGDIDLAELQRRCLAAGAVRAGDILVLWDWVNGKVFGYDGFQLIEMTEMHP